MKTLAIIKLVHHCARDGINHCVASCCLLLLSIYMGLHVALHNFALLGHLCLLDKPLHSMPLAVDSGLHMSIWLPLSIERDLRESSKLFAPSLERFIIWRDTYQAEIQHTRKFYEHSIIQAEANCKDFFGYSGYGDPRLSALRVALRIFRNFLGDTIRSSVNNTEERAAMFTFGTISTRTKGLGSMYKVDYAWCASELLRVTFLVFRDNTALKSIMRPPLVKSGCISRMLLIEAVQLWQKYLLAILILYLTALVQSTREPRLQSLREAYGEDAICCMDIFCTFVISFRESFASSFGNGTGISHVVQRRGPLEGQLRKLLQQLQWSTEVASFYHAMKDCILQGSDLAPALRRGREVFEDFERRFGPVEEKQWYRLLL